MRCGVARVCIAYTTLINSLTYSPTHPHCLYNSFQEDALRRRTGAETLRKTFVYTPEVVKAMIQERQADLRVKNVTTEKMKLKMRLEKATEEGDGDAMKQAKQALSQVGVNRTQSLVFFCQSLLDGDAMKRAKQALS
jgi:hypothetical protein